MEATRPNRLRQQVPEALNYFGVVFGVVVGAVGLGDVGRRARRKFRRWRRERGQDGGDGGDGGDVEAGGGGIELAEMDLGLGAIEWGVALRGRLNSTDDELTLLRRVGD
ncbi:hypothetical protein N7467_009479 [Penicillium canescens]|nr:hypothetical protein N7467_009479 [Penicillium canescens]